MSVFGGDSWARDAQQRKRRLDDLMLPASASSSPSMSDSFRRLPNGKLACLVCPNHPVLDSPLMLSIHNKGARHIAAESKLREKELSRKHEINKRLAISSDASHSNSGNPSSCIRPTNMKEKPLIEQTRRAILEAQSSRFNNFNGKKVSHDLKGTTNTSYCDTLVAPSDVPMEKLAGDTGSIQCNGRKGESFAGNQFQGNLLSDWKTEVQKRQEQELRFTASGWKRDGHGRWYRDENVEFDSDEDDPNGSTGNKLGTSNSSLCNMKCNQPAPHPPKKKAVKTILCSGKWRCQIMCLLNVNICFICELILYVDT